MTESALQNRPNSPRKPLNKPKEMVFQEVATTAERYQRENPVRDYRRGVTVVPDEKTGYGTITTFVPRKVKEALARTGRYFDTENYAAARYLDNLPSNSFCSYGFMIISLAPFFTALRTPVRVH